MTIMVTSKSWQMAREEFWNTDAIGDLQHRVEALQDDLQHRVEALQGVLDANCHLARFWAEQRSGQHEETRDTSRGTMRRCQL